MEISNTVLLLYGLIGVAGAASVILFVGGFIVYVTRIGTTSNIYKRELGINLMAWAVTTIVVTILLIGILRYMLS